MVKKYLVPLCIISLLLSLIFNSIQYKDIREYKQKQSKIDNDVKASINQLIQVFNSTDFSKSDSDRIRLISSETARTVTLVRLSSFSDDENIYNCFLQLDFFFGEANIDKVRKNGEQIKNLMNKVLDRANSYNTAEWKINSKDCKALVEFFQQIAKSS